jgi:NAD(P)-dependent dehydrogenase (short-subunit alcohol dehydrogenase family)
VSNRDLGPQLTGKTAIVTGGASGLGFGIARRFVEEGARVILADIDVAGGSLAAESLGHAAFFAALDTSREDQWQNLMAMTGEQFGGLDILVNNAGVTLMGSVEDVSIDDFDRTWAINTRGTFLGCRFAIGLMKAKQSGALINIASVSAFKPQPELVAYNASKAAITLMSQSIALHCAKEGYGIRCNSINPGVIRTPMLEKVIAQVADGEALMDSYKAMHPIGRIGEPDDIASMAVYLASDAAAFITGSAFNVDGGLGIN